MNVIVPNAWDVEWTGLDDGVILNQTPGAGGLVTSTPEATAAAATAAAAAPVNVNGVTSHSVPLNAGSGGTLAVLAANPNRSLLLIQNNSTATAPDVAPTFYIGFGQLAQVGQGLGLPPGVGVVFDTSTPTDAVYLTIGPSTDSDDTVVVQGVAIEGTPSQAAANALLAGS